MQTLTVTIGRNIKNVLMPQEEWNNFQEDIEYTIKSVLNPENVEFIEGHYGTGSWSGKTESSCKIMFALSESLTDVEISTLKRRLKVIRGWYAQDAIAFNLGESELI
jgi:hypothetical protein